MIIKQSKTTKATWLNRSGEVYNLHLDKKLYGLRINVKLWHDTNTYDVNLIEGNGRKENFVNYFALENIQPSDLNIAINNAQSFIQIDDELFQN